MQISIIQGVAAFTELAADWNQLASQSITNTPFQTLAYQQAWWQHLQPAEASLYTIVLRNDSRELTAVAPLYLTVDGTVHFNGCVEETDYLDLIVRPEDIELAWTAVFDCLCSSDFPTWQSLDFCNIPSASPTRTVLPQLAANHHLKLNESVHEVCPIIQLPNSFDAYLQALDSKQRREVSRKLRRAQGAEAKLKVITAEDDLDTAVTNFLDLLQKSSFEKRDWLNRGRRAIFYATAKAAQEAGTLQLLFIEIEGQRAAALFNFDYNGRIWVYNSGLDPNTFGSLSLGVVITALAIEHAIVNGRSEFDFLRGDETYKYRFGAKDTQVYRLQITKE